MCAGSIVCGMVCVFVCVYVGGYHRHKVGIETQEYASLNRSNDTWYVSRSDRLLCAKQGCDKPVKLDFSDEAFVLALGCTCDISEPSVHAPEALRRSQ